MPAFALVLLVGGAFLLRQVVVGRAKETPTDLKDAATSLLAGDTSGLAAVMARRGSNTGVGTGSASVGGSVDGSGQSGAVPTLSTQGSTALAAECVRLGEAASGYILGATGPKFYDCSGLVWKAAYNIGLYKGPRFTTATFAKVAPRFAFEAPSPKAGDVVLWVAGGHMGVMVTDTEFYSARSPSKGIGMAPLSADIDYFHAVPQYWRIGTVATTHGGHSQAGL